MAVITENPGLITLVVVFQVEPEEQDDLVNYLVETAHQHSEYDGFVSCSVHQSTDGLRIVEYIQWRSMADLQAMVTSPAGQEHLRGRGSRGEMHMFDVSAVVEVGS